MARKKMTEAEKKAWRAKMVAAKAAKAKAAGKTGDAPAKPRKPRKPRTTTTAQPAAEKPAKPRKPRKTTTAKPAAEKPAKPRKPRKPRKTTTAKPAAAKKPSRARGVGLPSGDAGRYLVIHAGAGKGGISSVKAFRTQKDAKDYVAGLNGGRALVVEVLFTAA